MSRTSTKSTIFHSSKKFEKQDTQGIDVRFSGDSVTEDLLRCHVSRSACTWHRSDITIRMPGNTEIAKIDMTALVDHDIGSLDITFNAQ